MSFDFFENNKDNKAQWHFLSKNSRRDYDATDDEIVSDVLGSYTGSPLDDDRPIQDADDL